MKKLVIALAAVLLCTSSWGQGVYRAKDNTVTTSITNKKTTVEIEEKVRTDFRKGWQVGVEYMPMFGLGVSGFMNMGLINAGYVYNHWYWGAVLGGGGLTARARDYWYVSMSPLYLLGVETKYYFGRKQWTPYLGAALGLDFGNYYEHYEHLDEDHEYSYKRLGYWADVEVGVRYYFSSHISIDCGVDLLLPIESILVIGPSLGVSYLF